MRAESAAQRRRRPANTKDRARLVIADDDPVVLSHIKELLDPYFSVVLAVGNGRDLVDGVQRLTPSGAVTDINMPEWNGLEATRRIARDHPKVKVIVFSIHDDPFLIQAAFDAGASGYVFKYESPRNLISSIQVVLAGGQRRPH